MKEYNGCTAEAKGFVYHESRISYYGWAVVEMA
jgi:hypothetical protein